MARYVALLRGINVGGRNKVAMADFRRVTASLGHTEVATYIQSGNVVFTSPDSSTISVADALEQEIARSLGVQPAVVVLSRAGLAQVIADNPFPQVTNPKCLHAVFRRQPAGRHRPQLGDGNTADGHARPGRLTRECLPSELR